MRTDAEQQLDDTGKVVFDAYYNQPDPRAYFTTIHELDYCIPGEAQPILSDTLKAVRSARNIEQVKVGDLGCSYGVNAALMKCDVGMDDLYDHYDTPEIASWERQEVLERDRRYFNDHVTDVHIETIGIDPADEAVSYGVDAGILQGGITTNLEDRSLTSEDAALLVTTDLVMSTGCIGYATERSMEQILAATADRRPWMAHFVLRMFSYEPFTALLNDHGYVTESLDATFRQRRFGSPEERANVLGNLDELGIDPAGMESEGWYHARFFLSRPVEEAQTPISFSR